MCGFFYTLAVNLALSNASRPKKKKLPLSPNPVSRSRFPHDHRDGGVPVTMAEQYSQPWGGYPSQGLPSQLTRLVNRSGVSSMCLSAYSCLSIRLSVYSSVCLFICLSNTLPLLCRLRLRVCLWLALSLLQTHPILISSSIAQSCVQSC